MLSHHHIHTATRKSGARSRPATAAPIRKRLAEDLSGPDEPE